MTHRLSLRIRHASMSLSEKSSGRTSQVLTAEPVPAAAVPDMVNFRASSDDLGPGHKSSYTVVIGALATSPSQSSSDLTKEETKDLGERVIISAFHGFFVPRGLQGISANRNQVLSLQSTQYVPVAL